MKIILSGYYGFDNAGDEALLSAITTSIKELEPQAEFVVFSGAPKRTSLLHNIKAIHYMNPLQLIKELITADLLISGGGSIFQDVTSTRSLIYYITVVALAKLFRTPVMFYAQGVGPINKNISKNLMRLIANRVDLITLRDIESGELLTKIGVTKPPRQITADPVFSLKAQTEDIEKMQKMVFNLDLKGKPLIGVSVRKWEALDGYQAELALLLDDLIDQGYEIIFIPLAYPQDIEESEATASLMQRKAHIIKENLSSQEHLALIAELDFLIGIRLHSLVFAAQSGVPFAGISYDPKVSAFLATFGQEPLTLKYEIMREELTILLNDKEFGNIITRQASQHSKDSVKNAKLALSLIKTRKSRKV
ncbi:MAG TPA: polysaccharide pyruvyl transferase CsaB [Syntrophomonadaceae bacterium]|nr:polysaccharide pyruvyl transferase CsaB [Syntrophomonadaceae bacterium]